MRGESDRRWHRRQRSAHGARVVLDDHSRLTCTAEDLSASGAQIAFTTAVELPAKLVLEVPSMDLRVDARVVWSRGERHGIRFIWPQHAKYR